MTEKVVGQFSKQKLSTALRHVGTRREYVKNPQAQEFIARTAHKLDQTMFSLGDNYPIRNTKAYDEAWRAYALLTGQPFGTYHDVPAYLDIAVYEMRQKGESVEAGLTLRATEIALRREHVLSLVPLPYVP